MKSQKFIKSVFILSIIFGSLVVSNFAFAAIAERESTGAYAGSYDLSSLWGGKLESGSQLNSISASYIFDISTDPDTLLTGDKLTFTQTDRTLLMQAEGGVLSPAKLATGSWNNNPSDGNLCTGGAEYLVGSDNYNFSLCSKLSGFTLASSASSVVSCAGQSCEVLTAGTATITATPLATSIYIFGKSLNNGNIQTLINNPSVTTGSVSWKVQAYDPPKITKFTANGSNETMITAGESVTLDWSVENSDNCTASTSDSEIWTGPKALSGPETVGPLNATHIYTLTCSNKGGESSAMVRVSVNSFIKQPTIDFYAEASQVGLNETTTLHWNVTDATTCSVSSPNVSSWNGIRAISGSESTGAITENSEFWITCSSDEASASKVVSVRLSTFLPPMTLTFTANTENVDSGQSVDLYWAAENAASCEASGNWSGNKSLSGTETVGPLSADVEYILTCKDSINGEIEKIVDVTVNPLPGPDVDFWIEYGSGPQINPSSVPYQSDITLKWETNNAINCSASGDWTHASLGLPNGSELQEDLIGTKIYNISCESSNGVIVVEQLTITAQSGPPKPITLNFVASAYHVASGGSSTLTWSTTNANYCIMSANYWTESSLRSTSGTLTTTNITSDENYTLECGNTVTGAATVTGFITITVGAIDEIPGIGPEIDYFRIDPASFVTQTGDYDYTVLYNTSPTLRWSSPTALSCTASGNWLGNKTIPSGSQTMWNLRVPRTYTLSCSNLAGTTVRTINVAVAAQALPEISNLRADDSDLDYNTGTTIRYDVDFKGYTSGTYCQKNISKPEGGFEDNWYYVDTSFFNTGNLQWDTTYRLYCASPAGSTMQSITVNVGDPSVLPTLNFTANTYSVPYNNPVTLTWAATDAGYCEASGDWSGIKSRTGSRSSGNLIKNSLFTLTCFNSKAESVAKTISIAVGGLPPIVSFTAPTTFIPYNTSVELEWNVQSASDVTCVPEDGDSRWSALGKITAKKGVFQTENLRDAKIYKLHCANADGEKTVPLMITVGGSSETGPSVNFWASDNVADSNDKAVLHWTSLNATTCVAGSPAPDNPSDWTGDKGTSGTATVSGITTSMKYWLTCKSSEGNLSSKVVVVPHDSSTSTMTLDFWSNKDSDIPVGEGTIVHWKSFNAISCTAKRESGPDSSGVWIGSKELSGGEYLGPFLSVGEYILSLTCEDQQGKTLKAFLALNVGQGGKGAQIVIPPVKIDDGISKKELPVKMIGSNAGSYMFNATKDASKDLYLSWTTLHAVSCKLTDNVGTYFDIGGSTNANDYNIGSAGSKGRTLTLWCYDSGGGINSVNVLLAAYKYEACLGKNIIVKDDYTNAKAYYMESDKTGNPDLSSYFCGFYNSSSEVTSQSNWGKAPNSPAIKVEQNPSDKKDVKVTGLDIYTDTDLRVTADYDFSFGNIRAEAPVQVDVLKNCYGCGSISCIVASEAYKNLGTCPGGEFEDKDVCNKECSRSLRFREVTP